MAKQKETKKSDKGKNAWIKIATIAILIVLFLVFCIYENTHLVVTCYTYSSGKMPDGLAGYRIVQISDLHNATFGKGNEKLVSMIDELNPDVIVLTGDIVDSNHTDIRCALEFASVVANICPIYYVTGNHEYWLDEEDYNELMSGLRQSGVNILSNEISTISYNGVSYNLVGLDDKSLLGDVLLDTLDTHGDEFNVVLAHEPQYLYKYVAAGSDLVITGHAHGGQFRLPFIGAVYAPDQGFLPDMTEGVHTQGNTTMIISRGLGNSVIPVRLFNDPEIVCIDFE